MVSQVQGNQEMNMIRQDAIRNQIEVVITLHGCKC